MRTTPIKKREDIKGIKNYFLKSKNTAIIVYLL